MMICPDAHVVQLVPVVHVAAGGGLCPTPATQTLDALISVQVDQGGG